MIDTKDEILSTLADDFVDLHKKGAIDLDQWRTALDFVMEFYTGKGIRGGYQEIGEKR
jgi:hypothetical protein